jgi:hypothetical protein
MRLFTLAAMASLTVCCFGCGDVGLGVDGWTLRVVAMLFMRKSSLAFAFAFHAGRGM